MRSMPSSGTRRSLAAALQVVGDRWTFLLVHDMALGLCRFDELRATGIPSSTLSLRLKAFEAQGLVERVRYENRPPRDEYRLTETGRDLWTVIAALRDWGDRWDLAKDGAPGAEPTDRWTGDEHRPALLQTSPTPPMDRAGDPPRSAAEGAARAFSQAADQGTRDSSDRLGFYFDF